MMPPVSFQGRELAPRHVEVLRATLMPGRLDPASQSFEGGVYDRSGMLVAESLRPALLGDWVPSAPAALSRSALGQGPRWASAIFGGHFFPAWGHFLLESLSTSWAHALPQVPVVFLAFAHNLRAPALDRLLGRAAPLLAAAGWGDRPISIVAEPISVDRLYVPERLSVFGTPFGEEAIHQAMRDVYGRLNRAWPAQWTGPVVAQRPAGHERAHPSEQIVYAALGRRRAHLMDGAGMSAEQQVMLMCGATLVIGFSGSSLHNAAFAPEGTPVVEISDIRSAGTARRRNRTQAALCDLLRQPYLVVDGYEARRDGTLEARNAGEIVDEIDQRLGGLQAFDPRWGGRA